MQIANVSVLSWDSITFFLSNVFYYYLYANIQEEKKNEMTVVQSEDPFLLIHPRIPTLSSSRVPVLCTRFIRV